MISWTPFLLLCVAMELTPGPNMAYLAVLTLSSGKRAGWFAIAGIALGLATIGVLAALGVAAFVSASPPISQALAIAGFAYLLWLAVDTWRTPATGQAEQNIVQMRHAFTRGLITNLLNPKAFVFYVAVLPGFITVQTHPLPQALLLTAITVAIASSVHVTILLLASRAAPYLLTPTRQRVARRVMAVLLVAIALWFGAGNLHRAG